MSEEHTGGKCYHCQKEVSGDFYCYGCKEYICNGDECSLPWSVADALVGSHDPDDHKTDPESAEGQDILGGF